MNGMRGRVVFLTSVMALAGLCFADDPAPSGPPPATEAAGAPAKDPRPLVRLIVRNDFKPEDKFFAQLVEGRLVSDLADMETFRTGARDVADADYILNISIRDISYNASTVYSTSKDADAGSSPQATDQALLSVDLYYTLEDRQGKMVQEAKLTTSASHEIEISSEHTANILKEEMIDRAAQRLERVIRKKIKKK